MSLLDHYRLDPDDIDKLRARVTKLERDKVLLRNFANACSLDEYESTSSASEKVHAHARKARAVLKETE
jgi:hypothetical protein